MADMPGVQRAYDDLVTNLGAAGAHPGTAMMYRTGVLQAAVQLENANVMASASKALSESIDKFTTASDAGTRELSRWTKRYSWAAWALVFATIVQIGISVALLLAR